MRKAIVALAVLVAAHSGFVQTFEVASVKPEPTGSGVIPQARGSLPPETEDIGPTPFPAVRQQLGLKLTAKKGPVEIIVIDRAEKQPSEN
jgi:hypothetical protein